MDKGKWIVLSGAATLIGLAVCCIAILLISSSWSPRSTPTWSGAGTGSRATPTRLAAASPVPPTPTLTRDPSIAPPYEELCKRPPDMTDVQFERHFQQFAGKRITDWPGWVYDVTQFGGIYQVSIAMRPPGGLLWSRQVEINNIPADLALSLNKQQPIVFSGTIREVGLFLGQPCNPIHVENADIHLH